MSLIKPSFSTGYARNASESANPNLWKGLVGAWMPSFGVTGEKLRDVSGNGNDGTLTNMDAASDWVGTSKGLALDFDGSNDYAVIPSSKNMNFGFEDFTWSFLTNSNQSQSGTIRTFGNIVSTPWSSNDWIVGQSSPTNFVFYSHNYSSSTAMFSHYLPYNQWNRVTIVRRSNEFSLYINDFFPVQHKTFSGSLDTNDNRPFYAGTSGIFSERWAGKIAAINIYNRALSPTEIKQLYLNPSAPFQKKTTTVVSVPTAPVTTTAKAVVLKKPKPSYATGYARNASESANPNLWKGLVGAWMPSFGVTGGTLKDVSGNGNDVVQVGAGAGWQASSLRNGSVNKYNPDINRYMIAEDASSIQPTSVTASFWVNVFALRNNESGFIDKQADPNASQNYLNTCFHGYVTRGYLRFRFASPSNSNHVMISDESSGGGTNTPFSNFLNEWLHVACTYDEKTGQANLYRNGQNVVTQTSSPSPLKTGTGDLLINGMHPVSRFCLNGLMNSMLLHNRALSPTEIKQLYLNPAAPFERKQQTVGISTAQAFNPYWGNQATQLAGTLQ